MNAFEPVMFHNLFESCQLLTKACQIFADKCVAGITVNETACLKAVNNSTGTITALSPQIGYEKPLLLSKKHWKKLFHRGAIKARRILADRNLSVRKN